MHSIERRVFILPCYNEQVFFVMFMYCVCFEDSTETVHIDLHPEAGEAAATICEPQLLLLLIIIMQLVKVF
jgi:hypothetical protein